MARKRLTTTRRTTATVLALLVMLGVALMAPPTRPATAQTPPPTPFDLMLVLDGSGSISRPDFELARTFARNLVNSCLFVSGSRIGVVQFASTAQLEHPLSSDRAAVDGALVAMRQLIGSTATDRAIDLAQAQLTANRRPGVRNFIIVFTDGLSNDPAATGRAADAARAAGTELFAVGIGLDPQGRAELERIANQPPSTHVFNVTDFASLEAALAPVVGAVCGVPVVPIVPREEEETPAGAEVWVVQRPAPNHAAPPGSIITVQVVTKNIGDGRAKDVRVTLPFDPAKVRLLDATFGKTTAWVSKVTDTSLTINTGPVGKGETITGTVRFQIRETLARDVALGERLSYMWFDDARGGEGKGNLPILTTGSGVDNRDVYTLAVSPGDSGGAGSKFTFASNIFASNEPVSVWYNLPDASVRAVGVFLADADGKLSVTFTAPGTLAPGAYSMVFYGQRTEFTAVARFTITR